MKGLCIMTDDSQKLIAALAINYSNVYYVDPINDFAKVIKNDGYIIEGVNNTVDLEYTKILNVYASKRVFEKDIPGFIDALNAKSLCQSFCDGKTQLEYLYRVSDGDIIHYYSANYIRVSNKDEELKLVAGFRNIDDIFKSRKLLEEQALFKAYNAISSIYLSMARVNVKDGTFHEIKMAKHILENKNLSCDFESQIKNIMTFLASEYSRKDVFEFIKLSTLPERMKDKSNVSMEFLGTKSGWCEMRFIKEDEDENHNPLHVIFTVQVIDEMKRKEMMLKHLSETDQMTKLYNRVTGERKIDEYINEGKYGMFCMMDVDHFKHINDTYGHSIGDDVIIAVADAIKKSCLSDDITLRLGGDEYVIYSPNIVDEESAVEFIRKLSKSFDSISLNGIKDLKVNLSIGAVFAKNIKSPSFDTLYHKADKFLYESKDSGGHSVTICGKTIKL